MLVDDGAIVYLNGQMLWWINMVRDAAAVAAAAAAAAAAVVAAAAASAAEDNDGLFDGAASDRGGAVLSDACGGRQTPRRARSRRRARALVRCHCRRR